MASSRPAKWETLDGRTAVGTRRSKAIVKAMDGIELLTLHVMGDVFPEEDDVFLEFLDEMAQLLEQRIVAFASRMDAGREARRAS